MKKQTFYNSTAWRWFSRYIMLSHAKESNGVYFVTCATSGRQLQIPSRKAHCGHLFKVYNGNNTNFATAFDERNVMPQSAQDNRYKSGEELKMAEAVDRYYGEGTVDDLRIKSKKQYWELYGTKFDKIELKEISDYYRTKFNELAKVKGNPWK